MVSVGQWSAVNTEAQVHEEYKAQLPTVFWGRPDTWKEYLAVVDTTASDPDVWAFLAGMVQATKAKVIVEAGTYRGHALFAMAEALWAAQSDGHIWSADLVDYHVSDALQALGLGQFVTLGIGPFHLLVEQHVHEPIDLAFVDASDPNNPNLRMETVDFLLPRMRKGGLIVVDDCQENPGFPQADTIRERCDIYLPLGRGTCVFQA